MSDEVPLIVERDGEALMLSLNNTQKKNALTSEMMGALSGILEDVKNYDGLRVIVIKGNGSVFCSGADINTWNPEELQELLFSLSDCPVPTIAHVHGVCFGGGMGLASACDFVIAEEGTKFGFPEVKIGMIPAVISPYVSRKMSINRMRELFITGESFGISQAYDFGFLYTLDSDIEKLMGTVKIFFKRNGILLNWKEFEKLDKIQKINTLAMIAPITNEEKQKLLEAISLENKIKTLESIISFYLYETSESNQTIQ